MDAQEARNVLVQVCERPTMWAGSSDFVHVALFIDGFMYGLDRAGVKDLPITTREFALWLGRRLLGGPTNQVWWAVMRDAFPDGREAIASLVPLLDEFLATAAEASDATGSRGTAADPDPREARQR